MAWGLRTEAVRTEVGSVRNTLVPGLSPAALLRSVVGLEGVCSPPRTRTRTEVVKLCDSAVVSVFAGTGR